MSIMIAMNLKPPVVDKKGRGTGRRLKKKKEARALTKSELGGLRGELKSLLAQRVNSGVP